MRVLIRTDASQRIGYGHVMRCLTLAERLRDAGCDVVFACRREPGDALALIAEQGFSVYALQVAADGRDDLEQPLNWQEDISALWYALPATDTYSWCVVDHYGLAADWQAAVRERAEKVLVIDDLANREHAADLLLDQGLGRQADAYASLIPATCRTLLGARYALLRSAFQGAADIVGATVQRVLVSFGGVDAGRETFKVLRALAPFTQLQVTIVAGSANPAFTELAAWVARVPNWQLHRHVTDFAGLMRRADLCIGAAGVTSWERALLGLPTLCIALAPNQCAGAQAFAEAGAHLYLGESAQVSVDTVGDGLRVLLANEGLRRSLAARSMSLTDGLGASRVACELLASSLQLRAASADDAALLFEGRNSEQVREVSVSRELISWEEHLAWLHSSLLKPERLLLIAEAVCGPVGMVRYDICSPATAEVSIYLFANCFGVGWGAHLLAAGEVAARKRWPELQQIEAQVAPHNLASMALFTRAGYQQSQCHFLRTLPSAIR